MSFLNKISTKIFLLTASCCIAFTGLHFFIIHYNLNRDIQNTIKQQLENHLQRIAKNIESSVLIIEKNLDNSVAKMQPSNFEKTPIFLAYQIEKDGNQNIYYKKDDSLEKEVRIDLNEFIDKIDNYAQGVLIDKFNTIDLIDLSPLLNTPLLAISIRQSEQNRLVYLAKKNEFFGYMNDENVKFTFVVDNEFLSLTSESALRIDSSLLDQTKAQENKSPFLHSVQNNMIYSGVKINSLHGAMLFAITQKTTYLNSISKIIFLISLFSILFIFIIFHFILQNLSLEIWTRTNKLLEILQDKYEPISNTSSIRELVYLDAVINKVIQKYQLTKKTSVKNTELKSLVDLSIKVNQLHNDNSVKIDNFLEHKQFFRPSNTVSGDLAGNCASRDNNYIFYYGSLHGKGVDTIVRSLSLKSQINALIQSHESKDLSSIFSKLNTMIYNLSTMIDSNTHANVCKLMLIELNSKTGVINYINAGCQKPIVISNNEISTLHKASLPLGIREMQYYQTSSTTLQANDRIIFFTDGLIKLQSNYGMHWNIKNLIEVSKNSTLKDGAELLQEIVRAAAKYSHGNTIHNDISISYLKIDKSWRASLDSPNKRVEVI